MDDDSARIFVLVALERADELLAPLREHFAGEPQVTVLVERRGPARDTGRRRAPVAERDPGRAVPSGLDREGVRLVQPLEPLRRVHEATGMDELIERSIAAEPDAVSELWWRTGARVMARLQQRLGAHFGGRLTSRAIGRILDELPRYDPERQPLHAWLDAVVDRYAAEHAS